MCRRRPRVAIRRASRMKNGTTVATDAPRFRRRLKAVLKSISVMKHRIRYTHSPPPGGEDVCKNTHIYIYIFIYNPPPPPSPTDPSKGCHLYAERTESAPEILSRRPLKRSLTYSNRRAVPSTADMTFYGDLSYDKKRKKTFYSGFYLTQGLKSPGPNT